MAPMTRCRAINNLPNDLMVEYYGQRTGAGLIITEGTSPTPNGLGYARIPGIFSEEQIKGWKKITDRVHQDNSKIFVQLMHTGRVAHPYNMPEGSKVVGASDIKAAGKMYTDKAMMQDNAQPEALSTEGVTEMVNAFVQAAKNAVLAGFDGVELHNANGYLMEQFLNPHVNNRTDKYGGSIENRCRFTLEVAAGIAQAIGKEKVGIRFSPFSAYNDMTAYDTEEVNQTYAYLAKELNDKVVYIHLSVNPTAAANPQTYPAIRANYNGNIMVCNGLTGETAEAKLQEGFADLVAFGTSFLANPDLVKRIETGAALNPMHQGSFYTADAKGYTDYPSLP